jgi:hypothetical protein
MATTAASTDRTQPSRLAKGAAAGALLALVVNIVVYAVGNMGAALRVNGGDSGTGDELQIGAVIFATVIWVVIGALALWGLQRVRADGFRIWAVAAVGVALLSLIPVAGLDVDTGSKVALAVLHLAVGVFAVAGQVLVRRIES